MRHPKRGKRYRRYGDFDLPKALTRFHLIQIIHIEEQNLYHSFFQELKQEKVLVPSSHFQEEFAFGEKIYWGTSGPLEELRKFYLIWPLLLEIAKRHLKLKVWPGISLEADPEEGLKGEPDYVVTKAGNIPKSPYVIIMEAKKDDFSKGWGQALTAMKAAQVLNARESSKDLSVYGLVTNGKDWEFGKLKGDHFGIYPPEGINILENEEKVKQALGLLDIIFEECEKNIQ